MMGFATLATRVLRRFRRDERGGMTAFGLLMTMVLIGVGGIALEVSNLYQARTQLQVAADLVGHAALYNRDSKSAAEAKQIALDTVYAGMPEHHYGEVLTTDDIVFGTYDRLTDTFTPDPTSRTAVMVTTARLLRKDNPVSTYFWPLFGIDEFDVVTDSVFTTFQPMCFREGFVAQGVVDIQSNNSYFNGFCIHSNSYVSLNQNNYFQPGTVVSMPDIADIDLPSSGFTRNIGLQEALRSGAYRLRIINQLPSIIENLRVYDNAWRPDYITSRTVRNLSGRRFDATHFTQGSIHIVSCNGNSITIDAETILQNVVIVTSCAVNFGNNVHLRNVVFATTSTAARSFDSPQGLRVGLNDNCAPGGGAQLLTLGGMNFAADLHMYGGQLIAMDNIEFAANANGVQGASLISAGEISGTSNMNMGFCNTGMEDNFEATYFRLAR
jgi:Flp pilus assembly protein TadG